MRSLAFVALVSLAPTAWADADADKIARADALFAEGKSLLDKSNLAEACKKFDESYALNPHAIGTLLNVALCDEKLGKLASALAKFTLARDMAAEAKLDTHHAAALTHVDDLTPRVPRVTLAFAAPPPPDVTIVIDGASQAFSALTDIAVDPGPHTVVVSAAGRQPFRTSFTIAERDKRTVSIPTLEKSVTVGSSRRTIGYIVGGSGAAIAVTGLVLGLVANSRYGDAGCSANHICPNEGSYKKANDAITLSHVGTAAGIVGGAAIIVGGVLWYLGRDQQEQPAQGVSVVPQIAPDAVGLSAVGRF